MGQRRRVPTRLLVLVGAALLLISWMGLLNSCTRNPTQPTVVQTDDATKTAGDRAVVPGGASVQSGAVQPTGAASSCVACHTSRENVKQTAAPPPAVEKSAEQSGEG